jgi:hypothetical protein
VFASRCEYAHKSIVYLSASQETLGVKFEYCVPADVVRERRAAPRGAPPLLCKYPRNVRIAGGVLAD